MYATAFNTTTAAVTVDGEGRAIPPGEWGTVQTTDDLAKTAIDDDSLVLTGDIPDDADPRAVAARDRTAQVAERAEALEAIDKPLLAQAATEHGVPGAEDLTKPQLVASLAARLDFDLAAIPEPPAENPPEPPAPAENPPVQPPAESTATPQSAPAEKTPRTRRS